MTLTIRDGWLYGTLPDDTGREWQIVRRPQKTSRGTLVADPDLCLHTTETDGYIEELRYPSNFQTGEGWIGQHIRLGQAGDSVNLHDREVVQIEMVGRSRLERWLPPDRTLGPTIALAAWLHRSGRIRTGLSRPNARWPVVLDRGPQAVSTYYRRQDGTWRKPGVYGHVEVPGNSHWDPGSFDYPLFFDRVRAAITLQEGDGMKDPRVDEILDAHKAFNRGDPAPETGAGVVVYRSLQKAAKLPVGAPGALPDHRHRGGPTGAVLDE